MAENSKIEWTDHTVNFWWGCEKVSPACANCYAEALDARFHPYKFQDAGTGDGDCDVVETPHWGRHAPRLLRLGPAYLEALRYERRARQNANRLRVFTNSMSDFFEDRRDLDGARLGALDTIRQTPHLDWLILTKRPDRILDLLKDAEANAPGSGLSDWLRDWLHGKAPANVWLGTTVESQEWADKRIPDLLRVPAAVRFLSCEPLLGPIDMRSALHKSWLKLQDSAPRVDGLTPARREVDIHWVIAGGESGPHARPMHPGWARGLRDQCAAAGVPFLFKQWGEWAPYVNEDHYTHGGSERHAHAWIDRGGADGSCWIVDDDGSWSNWTGKPPMDHDGVVLDSVAIMGRHGKKAAGRLLDGIEHNGYPEVHHA